MHSLDTSRLSQIFEALRENAHKLNSWECDRIEEWELLYERKGKLSEGQLECLERMYIKV